MFLLKKCVAPLLYPLPACATLLVAGVLLLWLGRRKRAGAILVTLGTGALLLLSGPLVSKRALEGLEQQYPPYSPAASAGRSVGWVVVLSGGSTDDARLPVTCQLSPTTIARLAEGIRVAKLHPTARLIVSGGAVYGGRRPEARLMRDLCVILGVPSERIDIEDKTRDTEEQALAVKRLVGADAFVLVTSASHMARSVALMRKQGLDPLPAPAEHYVRRSEGPAHLPLLKLIPSVGNLEAASIFAYERLGLLWARLRGNA